MGEETPPFIPIPEANEKIITADTNQFTEESNKPQTMQSAVETSSDEEIVIRSNILIGAINVALVVAIYLLIIIAAHSYMKFVHDINIVQMVISAFLNAQVPFMADAIVFLEKMIESFYLDSIIIGLIYAAYISNYEIRIKGDIVYVKKGFLWLTNTKFALKNVEQVFTEKYTFFPKTKQFGLKAFDVDDIKIPYVKNAEIIRQQVLQRVKVKHEDVEVEKQLHTPIKVANPS